MSGTASASLSPAYTVKTQLLTLLPVQLMGEGQVGTYKDQQFLLQRDIHNNAFRGQIQFLARPCLLINVK
jgi:hypothetical protein